MSVTTLPMGRRASKPTKPVRIYEDLEEKISAITGITKQSIAELLDPVLRPFVERKHREVIEQQHEKLSHPQNGNGHAKAKRKKSEG